MDKKDKTDAKGRTSAQIRAELGAMVQLKQKAESDLANSKEARAKQRQQKKSLQVAAYKRDPAAVKRRDEVNRRLVELELQESDLVDTVSEVGDGVAKLERELEIAEKSEAAGRMIGRQAAVMERMKKVWGAYELIQTEIKALWQLSREDWQDAAKVGLTNMSSRKYTHTWHLPDIIERLSKMAVKNEPLPHGDFLKPLPEMVQESQKAAKNEIERALKQTEQAEQSQESKIKEVA